eukprot:COSAG01_NODE_1035_length_11997_cov_95.509665_15_plen_53_part_00
MHRTHSLDFTRFASLEGHITPGVKRCETLSPFGLEVKDLFSRHLLNIREAKS